MFFLIPLIPITVAGFAIYGVSQAIKKDDAPELDKSNTWKYVAIGILGIATAYGSYKLYQNYNK